MEEIYKNFDAERHEIKDLMLNGLELSLLH